MYYHLKLTHHLHKYNNNHHTKLHYKMYHYLENHHHNPLLQLRNKPHQYNMHQCLSLHKYPIFRIDNLLLLVCIHHHYWHANYHQYIHILNMLNLDNNYLVFLLENHSNYTVKHLNNKFLFQHNNNKYLFHNRCQVP
jgi:hypothetical protein